MRRKKIMALILALSIAYSMLGCEGTSEQEKTEQSLENKTRSDVPELKVNQIGYPVDGEKMAVYIQCRRLS